MDAEPDVPPPIVPDDKNWTWVLDRPCPECGFDSGTIDPGDVAGLLRENTSQWVELLGGDEAALRRRPEPWVWSAVEYACHVRDVHTLYLHRLHRMLTEEGPHYDNWDQDVTAIEKRYHRADPRVVAGELEAAGEALADRFEQVTGDQWERTGFRSDGAAFTVATFARYFVHDPIHHLHDVSR